MSKTKYTELPVSITTDYEHETGDRFEVVRQRIEKAGFYVRTIFNSIKTAARVHEDEAAQASYELGLFCADLIHFAEIGDGIGETLFAASSDLTDFDPQPNTPNEIEKPAALIIAEQIAALLKNPAVPAPIVEAVEQGLNDFFNEHIDQTELNERTRSPEYIREMFENSDYFEIGGAAKL